MTGDCLREHFSGRGSWAVKMLHTKLSDLMFLPSATEQTSLTWKRMLLVSNLVAIRNLQEFSATALCLGCFCLLPTPSFVVGPAEGYILRSWCSCVRMGIILELCSLLEMKQVLTLRCQPRVVGEGRCQSTMMHTQSWCWCSSPSAELLRSSRIPISVDTQGESLLSTVLLESALE